MRRTLILAALAAALAAPFVGAGTADASSCYVNGYTRSDGTYVSGHYRSCPDSSTSNNWSSRGNQNPYTGEWGTRDPYRPSYGSSWGSGYGSYWP